MASIYLARLVGPVGFENVVVVKRMLPHLAEDPRFREMFADEARTVAKIRHPNVVRTFELVSEGDELYLVMEYLEGESLQRLAQALAQRKEWLSPALSCYVMAQAAAGLHAAHELADEDGVSLGVVHRDVSPHNIFVTLDGTVKVIDFGIAKSVDKVGSTSTGELKGKFAYMSPEQVTVGTVTRRTDIFALGITLWELLTGKRLFARDNQMMTLRAVTDEVAPPPSIHARDLPPELDAICAKCLAPDPADRYATAAELRQALLVVLRKLDMSSSAGHDPQGELARLMQLLFEKTLTKQRNMLRAARTADVVAAIDVVEVDPTSVEPSQPSQVRRTDPSPPIDLAPVVVQATEPRRSPFLPIAAASAALATLMALGAFLAVRQPASSTSSSSEAPSIPVDEPPEPIIAPAIVVPAIVAPAIVAPAIERVTLTFESDPTGALVTLDGVARGNTPLTIEVDRSEAAIPMELALEGRRTLATRVLPDHDQTLRLNLAAAGRSTHRTTTESRPADDFYAFE
jgi:serine/threonine protein kinase